MPKIDISEKACPECNTLFELHLLDGEYEARFDPMGTMKVVRMLICPRCGFQREDDPVTRSPQ